MSASIFKFIYFLLVWYCFAIELARDALNSKGYCVLGGYMSPVNDAYKKKVCCCLIEGKRSLLYYIRTCLWKLVRKSNYWIRKNTCLACGVHWSYTVENVKSIDWCLKIKTFIKLFFSSTFRQEHEPTIKSVKLLGESAWMVFVLYTFSNKSPLDLKHGQCIGSPNFVL